MSFARSDRTSSVSNHPNALRLPKHHEYQEKGSKHSLSVKLSSRGSRPGTASTNASIFNMLQAHKRSAAAASHLVTRQTSCQRERAHEQGVTEKAIQVAVRNICERNLRLPPSLVERQARIEFENATRNGNLFTAKDIHDIEDRIFQQTNFKVQYGDQRKTVTKSKVKLDTQGIFRSSEPLFKTKETFTANNLQHHIIKAGAMGRGPFRGNPNISTRDNIQGKVVFDPRNVHSFEANSRSQVNSGQRLTSNYAATISKAQTMLAVTNSNFGKTEQTLARMKLEKQSTNLPGFSELKIDQDLSTQLAKKAKAQMARDLRAQAEERQRRLQEEQNQELAYSAQIKTQVRSLEQNEHRRTRSMQLKNHQNREELLKQQRQQHYNRQSEWRKEKDLDFAQMCQRDLKNEITDNHAKHIKQAWQHSVAEVQRAQIQNNDTLRHVQKSEDLAYGQNLIKQLGYSKVQDKKPKKEPTGTLYDSIFASRVHQSKQLARRMDGTLSHAVTKRLQDEHAQKRSQFEDNYTNGGTLMEIKNRKKEDNAMTLKYHQQAANATHYKQQMEFRQSQFEIDKELNQQVQRKHDEDTRNYYRQEQQVRQTKRINEKFIESQVQAQMPQQKATRLQEHLV